MHRLFVITAIYDIDIDNVIKTLENKYNQNFTVLMRLHPNVADKATKIFKYSDKIINATPYKDIQELLLIADVLITDYSSCMFDFMLQAKPIFLITEDLQEYTMERDFYTSLDSLPFPVAYTKKELIKNIENFDNQKYINQLDNFLKNNGLNFTEKASIKIINRIINLQELKE